MAQAIDRLLGDSQLCRKLGVQAQERVRERFSFERYLDRMEGFLNTTT
jgi:hypothetical protein